MGKRAAEHQISKETYDSEIDNDVETGTFRKASESTISKRKIIVPRSRLNGNNVAAIAGGGTMKAGASPFGGFSFGITSQATASPNPAVIGTATSDSPRTNLGAATSPFGVSFSFANAQKSSSTTPLASVVEKSTPSVTATATNPQSEPKSRNPFASFAFSTAKTSAPSATPSSQFAAPAASASVGNMNTAISFNASPSEKPGVNGPTPLYSAKPPKETTHASSSTDSPIDTRTHLTEDDKPTNAPNKRTSVLDRLGTNDESSLDQRELTQLYAFLAALNTTLLAHLFKVATDYPICDMANVLEDNQKAREEIINIKCLSAARKVGLASTSLAHPSGSSSTSPAANKTSKAVVRAAVSTSSENAMQNTDNQAFGGCPTADSSNDVIMESDDAKTNVNVGTGNSFGPSGFAFGKKVGNMEVDDVKETNGSVSGFNFKCINTSNLETADTTSNKNPTASLGFSFPKPSTPSDNVEKSTSAGNSFDGNTKPIHGIAFGKRPDTGKSDENRRPLFLTSEFRERRVQVQRKPMARILRLYHQDQMQRPYLPTDRLPLRIRRYQMGEKDRNQLLGFGFIKLSSVSTENHSALGFGKPASFGAVGFSFGASAASTGEPVNKSLPSSVEDKDKGKDDVPEGEEESLKQNGTNDELIRKGAGEEDEESLHEVLCKVFKPSAGGTGFTDWGRAFCKSKHKYE